MASTASASLLDVAEENEWADEDVPYEDYEEEDDEDDEEDLALLFENASVAEHVILVDNTGSRTHQRENGVPSGPRFILPFVFATITMYA